MRMIDADALIAKLKDVCQHAEEPIAQMFICAAINDIKHAPTIEPSAQSNTFNALESLDCIDRQAALDALKRAEALTRAFGYHYVIDTIQELPSAQPERNKGSGSAQSLTATQTEIPCITNGNVLRVGALSKTKSLYGTTARTVAQTCRHERRTVTRILYGFVAAVIWAYAVAFSSLKIVGSLPNNDIMILTTAIIAAGAMAGGE